MVLLISCYKMMSMNKTESFILPACFVCAREDACMKFHTLSHLFATFRPSSWTNDAQVIFWSSAFCTQYNTLFWSFNSIICYFLSNLNLVRKLPEIVSLISFKAFSRRILHQCDLMIFYVTPIKVFSVDALLVISFTWSIENDRIRL